MPTEFDYTGYGPTSAGRAPSAAELRRASNNRYHTGRSVSAMQFMDPAAIAAAERMIRMGSGKDKSPEAVRRTLFSTTAGQATLDAAMTARSAGLLGYGDPRQYAANVTQMVSRGFGTNILENAGGNARMVGFGQRVSGNGMLAERASIGMQKALMTNLYGEGNADPRNLNGYDMTEASGIASRVVGRGGLGQLMGIKRNAGFADRLKAAQLSEVDPAIVDGLKGMTDAQKERAANIDVMTDQDERNKAIEAMSKEFSNPKAAAAFKDMMKSKDAIVFNEKNAKQLSETVREVTKGMAALTNIYGDLSSDEAHAMLEKVHGGRITNKTQARAAARTVDNLSNAAEFSGMDPRQMMALFDAQSEGMKNMLQQAFGTDSRSETKTTKAGTDIAKMVTAPAAMASKRGAEANKKLRDLGFAGFDDDGRSEVEVAADLSQRVAESENLYKARSVAASDMVGLNDNQKKLLREKAAAMDSVDGSTEEGRMQLQLLEREMRNIISPDFAAWEKSGVGVANLTQGASSEDKMRFTMRKSREALKNSAALNNSLDGTDLSDAEKATLNMSVMDDIGGKSGLARLAEIQGMEKQDERKAQMDAFFKENQISDDKRALYERALLGSGKDDKQRLGSYARAMGETDWTAGAGTTYAAREEGRVRLAKLQDTTGRRKMSDKDGKISVGGIANAIFKGDIKNPLQDVDTAAATMDFLKDRGRDLMVDGEDGKRINLADKYQSGINLTKGLTDSDLSKFDKVAGADLNLLDRVNKQMGTKMSKEELMAKSKSDKAVQDAIYQSLDKAGAELGFEVGGSAESMSLMGDDVKKYGGQLTKPFEQAASLRTLYGVMGEGQQKLVEDRIFKGEDPGLGDLMTADKYDANSAWDFGSNDLYSKKDGKGNKYKSAKLAQGGKFMKAGKAINNANAADLEALAKTDSAPELLKDMESQLASFEQATKDGATKMYTYNEKGQQVEQSMNEQDVNSYRESIERLRSAIEKQAGEGGSQKVGTMTVTKLEVTGDFNSKNK